MRTQRHATGVTAVLAALTLLATGCGSDGGGGDGDSVSFGYIPDFNGASLLAIAEDQGLWEEEGLSADYETFTTGPIQVQALGSGDLDFGYIGPGAMWLPASGRADIVALNTLTYADRVIAQPGIGSIQELRGKRVGVVDGTSGEMVLNLALQEAGMSKDDIEAVSMDAATIVSAFVSGEIDAAGLWYPAIDQIKAQVPDLTELASTEDVEDAAFPTAFVSADGADRELTERVVRVLQRANDYRAGHEDEAIALSAAMLDRSEEEVRADAAHVETMTTEELVAVTEDGTAAGWLEPLAEFFVAAGSLEESPDVSSYYAGDLYSEVFAQ